MNKLIILYNKLYSISDKIRFVLVGCLNAGISFIIFSLAVFLLGDVHYKLCVTLQWVLSSFPSYLNQKIFVFGTKGNYLKEYLKCCSTWAVSYVANMIILEIFMKIIYHFAHTSEIILKILACTAQFFSIMFVSIITYVLFKYFAFKKKGQSKCT